MTDPGRPFDLDERSVVPAATASDLGHENPGDHGEHDGGDRRDQADHDHGGEAVLEDAAGGVGGHGATVPTATLGPGDFPTSSEAFGNLALFGRSPFVPEWRHHIPPPDPASCAAFAALVEVA